MGSASGVHEICDRYVEEFAAVDPVAASLFGIAGCEHRLTDYSPAGYQERARIGKRALLAASNAAPDGDGERVARAAFTDRLGLEVETFEAGLAGGDVNVIASPVQDIRMVFDLMATRSVEDWAVIAHRLARVPDALAGVRASLLESAARGQVSARRQVLATARQARSWAGFDGGEGFFTAFVSGADVGAALRADLSRVAGAADRAYGDFAAFLRTDLAPRAPVTDAVGEDIYRLRSRYHLGAEIDLAEAYAWGWEEFAGIEAQMAALAHRLCPGATPAQTAAVLDADPRYLVRGRAGFQEWMQQLSDQALNMLRGTHFEIPDALMDLECRLAPPGGGLGAYYYGPSEDFARPGRMWWSVPADQDEFSTWREVSTVYHEGVPGHHLQIATAVHASSTLNRWQRTMSFTSGHGKGWALYAERLMRELGYLEEGALYGMLADALFRAARVIIDIGMHLEYRIPSGTGFHEHEKWTPDLGLEFLLTRTVADSAWARDEIDRYLGWPGQAPAYKIGERYWLTAREQARTRDGASFDLREFHTRALRMGGMGLDTLCAQLAT
ncbi:DUF885 domain-containing protein [Nocardia sp. NBC_01377]|uniref:DUF885 domain-containing protein n=1 Tax=Nocardia sp. NBC_01377 TaxID=2903595 RepID=UPI00324485C6